MTEATAPAKRSELGARDYLPTLDGWRAIAILGVFVCHGTAAVFGIGGTHPSAQLFRYTRYGELGVDIFFGISGFLICTRLLREEEKYGRISLKNFYIRRAFRILPPYFLYLAVLSLMAMAGWFWLPRRDLLSCLFFCRNYVVGSWYTGHFWSLAVEEHFYLLWPGILFLFGSRRSRVVVVVIAVAVAIWRAIEFRHGFISHNLMQGTAFFTRTDVRLDALLWGCWAALLFQSSLWRARFQRWITPLAWCGLAAIYLLCAAFKPPFSMMWEAIIIPLLLIGTLSHPEWWASALLEQPVVRWVGRISYGLYLWQQLFFAFDADMLMVRIARLQQLPLNIVAIFVCASLSYYLMERRLIGLGHSATHRRQRGGALEAAVAATSDR